MRIFGKFACHRECTKLTFISYCMYNYPRLLGIIIIMCAIIY